MYMHGLSIAQRLLRRNSSKAATAAPGQWLYPAATRRVLNCRQAQLLSLYLSLLLMHTIVCWPMAPPYISVDLSSSSRKKEPPLQQKISLCWFIYQDLRLHFDDHHHLFRFYFLCNFASYRHREFRNKRRGGKTNKQSCLEKKMVE